MGIDSLETAHLAAIVESSDDAVVSKDLNGIVTSWNRAAEGMFGYTAAEVVGRSIRLIIPADRQAEEDDVLRRIRRGQSIEHFETIRVRKNGETIPISLSVSPIRSSRGEIVGISKIARDISDRRRAERALEEAHTHQEELQRRLLALVAASETLFISPRVEDVIPATVALASQLMDADAYAVWRLDAAAGAWRIEASRGLSEAFTSTMLVPRGDEPQVPTLTEPIAIEDVALAPLQSDRMLAHADEGIRSMLAVPLRIRGEANGTLVFYYRAPHRFSEVDRLTAVALGNLASAAVSSAEAYESQYQSHKKADFLAEAGGVLADSLDYPTTLRHLADLAVPRLADWCLIDLAGPDGHIERLALAHTDPERVRSGREVQQRYAEAPVSEGAIGQVIRTGLPLLVPEVAGDELRTAAGTVDLRFIRELGGTSFVCVPLIARGQTVGSLTLISAESGRRFNNGDVMLAQDVAWRAALGMDNAIAYDEVRRANRLKDDFLATLSHELRTPLNAILGYSRMLRSGVVSRAKQDRVLDIVARNADSLTRIVSDVLDVSRIVSGKLQLHIEPVNLPQLLQDAVDTVLPGTEAKGIRLVVRIDRPVGVVMADTVRLRQIVWNLLSNAVKFTPRGGEILVEISQEDSMLELAVSDTGIGITPEFLPHVFERFRQADSRFSREHSGLGLGLAITRHLAELHGGTATAESEGSGHGATFRVQLPIATPASPDRAETRLG